MVKKICLFAVLFYVSAGLIGCALKAKEVSVNNDLAEPEFTETQKDGCLLFTLSYNDALALGESSDSIVIKTEGDTTTYTYTEHILSCGTHMNGVVTEVKNGAETHVIGDFSVSNNSYQIDSLYVDVQTLDSDFTSGTIEINGKILDFIKLYNA